MLVRLSAEELLVYSNITGKWWLGEKCEFKSEKRALGPVCDLSLHLKNHHYFPGFLFSPFLLVPG